MRKGPGDDGGSEPGGLEVVWFGTEFHRVMSPKLTMTS